jgi:ceramide glucosyltransferase
MGLVEAPAMSWIFLALGALALLLGIIPILMTGRFIRYVERKLAKPRATYSPEVTLVMPCKGIDLQFEENIRAVLEQDYPRYEVIFVTATDDDPAYVELRRLLESAAHPERARLLVAGIDSGRGQKITNLLKGIKSAAPSSEVFAFLDADVRVRRDYLANLVAPLCEDGVGATTGFPWYLPSRLRLGSLLRSLWGAGALPILADPKRNFASGAANALRREVFERGDVAGALARTVSDTFAITNSVRRLGLRVEFVPQCLVISPDDSTLVETLRWTNRQTTISRVYSPPFWWTVAITYSLANGVVALGFVLLLAAAMSTESDLWLPAALMLSLVPLEILNASLLFPVILRLLPSHAGQLRVFRWGYLLLAPLASVLILVNSVVSRTTDVIEWRGVRYRLVSAEHTQVLSGDNIR